MKQHQAFTTLIVLLLSTTQPNFARDEARPSYIRLQIAGYDLKPPQSEFVYYDSKEKYYLHSYNYSVGDYVTVGLLLSPSLEHLNRNLEEPVTSGTLPRLRSGWGVNIGETPQQVVRKLKRWPQHQAYNRQTKVRVYKYSGLVSMYEHSDALRRLWQREGRVEKKKRFSYSARYLFHNEKLWAIRYSLQTDRPIPQ